MKELMEFEKNIDSTWSRLGLRAAPDPTTSGKGIGIIILDEVISHSSITHLDDRIKKITVHDDLTGSCIDITAEKPKEICRNTEHGMKVIQLLAHQPFENSGTVHVGLAPAATFIFLAELEPEKIAKGLAWILQRQDEWNIRVLLNLLVP